jgi:hypothetical protein
VEVEMSCETPEPSMWDETITITRRDLGTCMYALEMLSLELTYLEKGTEYEQPQWLQDLGKKALVIAQEKQYGPDGANGSLLQETD